MSPSLWTRILLLVVFFDIDRNLADILTLSVSLSEAAAEISTVSLLTTNAPGKCVPLENSTLIIQDRKHSPLAIPHQRVSLYMLRV